MENYEELKDLEKLAMKEIRKVVQKGDLTLPEVDTVTKALCMLLKAMEYEERKASSNDPMDGEYSGGMHHYGFMPDPYYRDSANSHRRGRSSVTGRYMSRDMGYSGHSIEDRMIARLEQMMDEAESEYERNMIREEINEIRMKNR